ncbi:MAG: magnetochrome domain-containing protein, partial [Alphaproteobacteria bacterium]|nr:magnetochrome domain-containing protein [Alphaproteobacteria bacterium]
MDNNIPEGLEFEADMEDPEDCGKETRKYLFLVGAIAVLILIGTYWYSEYYAKGHSVSRPVPSVAMVQQPAMGAGGQQMGAVNGGAAAQVVNLFNSNPTDMGTLSAPAATPFSFLRQNGMQNDQPANMQPGMNQGGYGAAPAQRVTGQNFNTLTNNPGAQALNAPGTMGGTAAETVAARSLFANIAAEMRQSVVNINVKIGPGTAAMEANVAQPKKGQIQFADPRNPMAVGASETIGSGVIVRNDGYVLTNYHVVRGAQEIFVTVFNDFGSDIYPARIITLEEVSDLALIKLEPNEPLKAAVLGDSTNIRVADEVIAIGSPFGLGQTVSRGIVSAMDKTLVIEGVPHKSLIQTDAAINQGNSGGPLVHTNGTVIGINTAIYTPTGAFSGVGFAVPSNDARRFVEGEITLPRMKPRARAAAAQVGVGAAGPAIVAGVPAPHTDGRENMACTNCHQIITAGNGAGGQPVAWYDNLFGQAQTVAAPAGGVAPPIQAGMPAPHTDGRENMACANCHQILTAMTNGAAQGAPVAMTNAQGYSFAAPPSSLAFNVMATPVAAPAGAPPPILASATSPHTDGRETMACNTCHQVLAAGQQPTANPVAFGRGMGQGQGQGMGQGPCMQQNAQGLAAAFGQPGQGPCMMQQGQNFNANTGQNMGGAQGPVPGFTEGGLGFTVLGASVQAINEQIGQRLGQPAGNGVFVNDIRADTPMAVAGVKPGDIILKMQGRRLASPDQLSRRIQRFEPGENVRLSVLRNGKRERLNLVMIQQMNA